MSDEQQKAPRDFKLVTVFRTGNLGTAAIAKSMLQSAEIEYVTRNEELQSLFGWGNIFARPLEAIGGVEFQVLHEDADDAKELLGDLEE